MAASRLSDSQKQELVERYRQGLSAQALAQAYGCSPNTVSRVVKAVLDPSELAALKKQSRSRVPASAMAVGDPPVPLPAADPLMAAGSTAAGSTAADPSAAGSTVADPSGAEQPLALDPAAQASAAAALEHEAAGDSTASDGADGGAVLAIDDADDFGDADAEEGDDLDGDEGPEIDLLAASAAAAQGTVSPRPLHSGALPASVYLLVDKTVELDARPLREFPELGSLPDDEQDRQALMLYANPRQAKRQCGRSQRVIKVPDSAVLERTSRYLLAQGITRLVLEGGALFALPGG
jgi:hypothetical protein